jgi:Icc-related predicted phosphoesterase
MGNSPSLNMATLERLSSETEVQRVTVACISDTHGKHRDVYVPDADVLIHAGDFTHFGKIDDAVDFNDWLGTLPHQHKIVINGNHETNAPWKDDTSSILSNATFLVNSSVTIRVGARNVRIFGTQFYWPMCTPNPHYDKVTDDSIDVIVCHSPVSGVLDDGMGCKMLAGMVNRLKPRLVVSGHIHQSHGVRTGPGEVTYVNAANCKGGYTVGWPAIYFEMELPVRSTDLITLP